MPEAITDGSADVLRITAQELKAKLDAGQAVVFDARRQSDYAQRHIAGAISKESTLSFDKTSANAGHPPVEPLTTGSSERLEEMASHCWADPGGYPHRRWRSLAPYPTRGHWPDGA